MANWNDDKVGVEPESISRASAIIMVLIAACIIFALLAVAGGLP